MYALRAIHICHLRFAAGTILKITYGHEVTSTHDPFIQLGQYRHSGMFNRIENYLLAERAGTLTVEAGSSAANLVDFFPVMRQVCRDVFDCATY